MVARFDPAYSCLPPGLEIPQDKLARVGRRDGERPSGVSAKWGTDVAQKEVPEPPGSIGRPTGSSVRRLGS